MPALWTEEEKETKDLKVESQIHLHFSNDVSQDILKDTSTTALLLKLGQLLILKSLPNQVAFSVVVSQF